MKVSIGSSVVKGPWGGGNLFIINFKNFLLQKGIKVIHDLSESDIDVIILTDPRKRSESSSTFNHIDIEKYKKYVNPNVLVIQRINECDERKGTSGVNSLYLEASNSADHVFFVSSWLRDIYLKLGMPKEKTSVIMAGADTSIFNNSNMNEFNTENIKFITHHWSAHYNKGFEIYKQFDELLSQSKYKNLSFTYVGNVKDSIKFKNVIVKKPISGLDIAKELKRHDIYITASINEPSGNHHIEAAQCGLPILYKESGGITEYCKGYGVGFDKNFEDALNEIIQNFNLYKFNLKNYPFNSNKMSKEILSLIKLLKDKKEKMEYTTDFKSKLLYIFNQKILKFYIQLDSLQRNIKIFIKKLILKS